MDALIEAYDIASKERRIVLLAELIHQLTVSARGEYPLGEDKWTSERGGAMCCANEMVHRISRQIASLAAGDSGGFPGHSLFEVLDEWADTEKHRTLLDGSLRRLSASMKARQP